jgi:hypothetical protein
LLEVKNYLSASLGSTQDVAKKSFVHYTGCKGKETKMSRLDAMIFLVFSLLGLAACASESVLLVQPRTGATIKCSAAGSGLMAGMAAGMVDECVKKYEGGGYVPERRLTPEERSDLERRGVLPKPAEPRPTMF